MDDTKSLTEILTDQLSGLAWSAAKYVVESSVKDLLQKRKIRRAVEEAVDRVVAELERFLTEEVRILSQRELLVTLTVEELKPLLADPKGLFHGGLDGQKVFEQLYPTQEKYPEAIRHEQLGQVWSLFMPRVAALLCDFAYAIEEWRIEGWREGFRRLDEVSQRLAKMQSDLDAMVRQPADRTARLFESVRRWRRQRRELSVEVTGLGGESPVTTMLDPMFVHPAFTQNTPAPDKAMVENAEEARQRFLYPGARSVIVAPGGAGKTTWSRWLQRHIERETPVLVVLLELRRQSKPYPSIHAILKEEAGPHLCDELDATELRIWLESGSINILIDGLDELTPELRDLAYDWLAALQESVGTSPVCLTSRPLTTDHLHRLEHAGWESWMLDPFDHGRVCEYIRCWYQHAPLLPDAARVVDVEGLAEEWSNDETLAALTGNPLLLSTLLTVHHHDGELPAGRAKLYQRYVEGMLGIWDARRKIDLPALHLPAATKRRLLRDVAIHMFMGGQEALGDDEILGTVCRSLREAGVPADPAEALAQIRERTGLIIGPGTWSFAHKTVGEFLIAEAIVDASVDLESGGRLDRMWLYAKRDEDRANTIFFLWAGLVPMADLEFVVEQLLDGPMDDKLLGFGLCLDQFSRLSASFRRKIALVLADVPRNTEGSVWWFPFEKRVPTGNWNLRFVGGHATSYMLLLRLSKHGNLQWEDVVGRQNNARDTLWLTGRRPKAWSAEEEESSAEPPDSAPAYQWRLQGAWAALSGFLPSASLNSEKVREIVAFLERHSLLSHGVLLIILVTVHSARNVELLTCLLTLLARFADVKVDKHWLRRTRKIRQFHDEDTCDYLQRLSAVLDHFENEHSGVCSEKVLERCQLLCQRLLAERSELLETSNAPARLE